MTKLLENTAYYLHFYILLTEMLHLTISKKEKKNIRIYKHIMWRLNILIVFKNIIEISFIQTIWKLNNDYSRNMFTFIKIVSAQHTQKYPAQTVKKLIKIVFNIWQM